MRRVNLRFGLRWLLILVTVCAVLAWFVALRFERVQLAQHNMVAMRLSDALIVGAHQTIDSTPGMVGASQALFDALRLKGPPEYLLLAGRFKNGSPADEYERSILSDIKENKTPGDVYVRPGKNNVVTYYKIVRGYKTCYTCHTSTGTSPDAPLVIMKISY